MARVTGLVREALKRENLGVVIRHNGTQPFLGTVACPQEDSLLTDVSYVDDATYFVDSERAEDLVPKIKATVRIVALIMRSHGIRLNFKPNKTEALVCYRGPGTMSARRALFHGSNGQINIQIAASWHVHLRVVSHYKHLGVTITPDLNLGPEIRARTCSYNAAYVPLSRSVFGRQSVDKNARALLHTALLVSRLLYLDELWHNVSSEAIIKLRDTYMRGLRRIVGAPRYGQQQGTADSVVLRQIKAQSIDVVIRIDRLCALPRLLSTAPPCLLAMLRETCSHPRTWASEVLSDLVSLHTRAKQLESMPSPSEHTAEWSGLMAGFPKQWKTIVRKTFSVQYRDVDEGSASTASHGDVPLVVDPYYFPCQRCNRMFRSGRALRTHLYKSHGVSNGARQWAVSSKCAACAIDFQTRLRCIDHLAYRSKKCLDILMQTTPPLSDDECAVLDAEDAADRLRLKSAGYGPLKAMKPALPPS